MKHRFYGEVNERKVNKYHQYKLEDIELNLRHDFTFYQDSYFRKLNKYKDITPNEITINIFKVKDIFITEKDDIEMPLSKNQEVTINNKGGRIVSTNYDVNTDTMHYYTDIEVITQDNNIEEKTKQFAEFIKLKSLELLEQYFPEEKEVKQSFWSKIFKRKSEN